MNDERTTVPFSVMALTVPAVEAAAGKNWLPTLILALASFLLCAWMSVQEEPDWKWFHSVQSVVLVLLLSWALGRTHSCWPGEKAEWAIPAGLILLAMYAVWKQAAIRASSVLRYGMYIILGFLGILGIQQLKLENLRPAPQLPDMQLAVILLLPLLARKAGNWVYHPVGAIALVSSVVVGGCSTIYQYSRGLSMGAVAGNMESIAACAVTVGNYALMCYLLDGINRVAGKRYVWISGLTAYGLYTAGIGIRPEAFVIALLTLWVFIPALWSLNRKRKKNKKSA